MKKLPISLICGAAAILLTIILYFTILGNALLQAIHFIALVAIVLAEAVTTFYAYISKGNPRRVAAAIVTSFMIPASIILSIVYIIGFPKGYGTYIGFYFAGMIIVNMIALILLRFDASASKKNNN